MIIQVMGIVAHPDKEAELGVALSTLRGTIESTPGCIGSFLYQDWSSSNVLYLESRWEKREDLTTYLESDAYRQLLSMKELLLEEPRVEFLIVTERRGLDFIRAVRES